ncbi:MAG: hypothetical protein NC453_20150 [Muribaculum sp.]|nr:hypothetical protein [Muribaculum sp.]
MPTPISHDKMMSIARRKLSIEQFWPHNGCIGMGWNKDWDKTISTEDKSSAPSTAYWTLGCIQKFLVSIYLYYGLETGFAYSKAIVYYRKTDSESVKVTEVALEKPNDILSVVEALQEKYLQDDSSEAKEWRNSMADFEKELAEFAVTPIVFDKDDPKKTDEGPFSFGLITPYWLHSIIDDSRYMKVNADSSLEYLRSYMRFKRSWSEWYSVEGMMCGSIYNEDLERNYTLLNLIDKRFEDKDQACEYSNYFRLLYYLLPSFIGACDEDKNIKFIKHNAKWLLWELKTKNAPIGVDEVQLMLDVREDNTRLQRDFSDFIRKQIPEFIKLNDDGEHATLSKKIDYLTVKARWTRIAKKKSNDALDALYSQLAPLSMQAFESNDADALYKIGRLYTEYFSVCSKEADKETFYQRIKEEIISRLSMGEPTGTDILNLAATYLEYIFTKTSQAEVRDITTFSRDMYAYNLAEANRYRQGRYTWKSDCLW